MSPQNSHTQDNENKNNFSRPWTHYFTVYSTCSFLDDVKCVWINRLGFYSHVAKLQSFSSTSRRSRLLPEGTHTRSERLVRRVSSGIVSRALDSLPFHLPRALAAFRSLCIV